MPEFNDDNTYVIFQNNKRKHDRSPNQYGHMQLSPETVQQLGLMVAEGKPAKLRLSQWEKQSPRVDGTFYSGKVEADDGTYGNKGSRDTGERRVVETPTSSVDTDDIPFELG